VGFLCGTECLAGVLAGSLTSGFMLAIEMSNAGGAWDNAKKWVEGGNLQFGGETFAKRTPYHDATVVGDTVGDPFKDTSGPALNVLIKLMTLVSLVLAPAFKSTYKNGGSFATNGAVAGIVLAVVIGLLVMMFQNAHKKEESDKVQPHSAEFWKQMKAISNAMDQAPNVNMKKIETAVGLASAAEKTYQAEGGKGPGPRATTPAGGAELAVSSSSATA